MTLLRDAVLDPLPAADITQIAVRLRHHCRFPHPAVALVINALRSLE